MTIWIARLRFHRAVRFGLQGIGLESVEETCRSDTLFSAIVHAWLDLFGEKHTEKFLRDSVAGKPPFVVSSGFLFHEETLFLPRPRIPPTRFHPAAEAELYFKDVSRCSYVPLDTFEKWVRREPLDVEKLIEANRHYAASTAEQVVPHVALDRISAASQIYHSAHVLFADHCGLWVLVKIFDDSIVGSVQAAFRILGEKGLGGDKSLGLGAFELEGNALQPAPAALKRLFEMNQPSVFLTLSLFHPPEHELEMIDGTASYSVIRRKGWISSPVTGANLKRKSVSMFVEGSVFGQEFKGHLVDVTPNSWREMSLHPVYRNGFALMVPVRVSEAP